MSRPSRRWRRLVTLVLALMALALAAVVKRLLFPGRSFDAVQWKTDEAQGAGPRLAMADRLVARGTLEGRTRAEVVALLGEPPPTEYFRDWDLVYWLGPERGSIAIDSEWLAVRLGADGTVAMCRIVRD